MSTNAHDKVDGTVRFDCPDGTNFFKLNGDCHKLDLQIRLNDSQIQIELSQIRLSKLDTLSQIQRGLSQIRLVMETRSN